jgi:hypothetical protein
MLLRKEYKYPILLFLEFTEVFYFPCSLALYLFFPVSLYYGLILAVHAVDLSKRQYRSVVE